MDDAEAFEKWVLPGIEDGQRTIRCFSMSDIDQALSSQRSSIELRMFNNIQHQFDLDEFKVSLDVCPFPSQEMEKGRVRFTLPHDRNKAVPVAILRTGHYIYSFQNLLRKVYGGFSDVVDEMTTEMIDFLKGFLEQIYGDNYFDRRGQLWFFGVPCFNWILDLEEVTFQTSAMVGGMFVRSNIES